MKSRTVQGLLVILSIALFIFATLPAYKIAQALRQETINNEKTLELAAQLKKNREDLEDRYRRITDEQREGLRKLIPDTLDNVRLVNDISDIATSQGLKIRGINVENVPGESSTSQQSASADAASRKQRYGTLGLSFSTTATYSEFADLLRELERSLRLVDVRSISIKSSPTKIYDFTVRIETYWLR